MYFTSCTYPSKPDFDSIGSPLLTGNGTAQLDHSTAAARRLSEYRGDGYEPRQQCPWKWTVYQANCPITSPPSCFRLPREAVHHEYHGSASPPEAALNTGSDYFLHGASGPRYHAHAFVGDPRSFPGRHPAFNPDSQLLFPESQNRVLPPVFDKFFEYQGEGAAPRADNTRGGQQEKEMSPAEWTSCHSGESSDLGAGSESPPAGREDEEDAPSFSGSGGDHRRSQSKLG